MAFALVGSVSAGSVTNDNVTTGALATTGATLLVAAVASGSGTRTLTDSLTNTWIALTRRTQSSSGDSIQLFYARPSLAQVGAAQTFTVTSTTQFPAVAVAAYSGAISAAVQGDANVGSAPLGTQVEASPGTVTSVDSNELLVCAAQLDATVAAGAVSSPFTLRQNFVATANAFGVMLADSIETVPATRTPRFTWTTAVTGASALSEWHVTPGATSDDYSARADANTYKRAFLQSWYATNNADLSSLMQRWIRDTAATSPAGATSDISSRDPVLLERAARGLTS